MQSLELTQGQQHWDELAAVEKVCVCVCVCACKYHHLSLHGIESSDTSEWDQYCTAASHTNATAANWKPHPLHPVRAAGTGYSHVLIARQPLLLRGQRRGRTEG